MLYLHQPLGVALILLFITRNGFHRKAAAVWAGGCPSGARRQENHPERASFVASSFHFLIYFIFATLVAPKVYVDF